jgi:hypothetical protein
MTYQLAFAIVKKSLQMGESGVIPANRGLAMAIGTAAQFELALRQGDIIGKWSKAVYPEIPHAEYDGAGEMWVGAFRWDNASRHQRPRVRQASRCPTIPSFSHYWSGCHTGSGLAPSSRASTAFPFGSAATGNGGARSPARPGSQMKSGAWARAGAITEADEAGIDPKVIQDFATHTDKTSTERYRRRGSVVAGARAELRKAAGGDGDEGQ